MQKAQVIEKDHNVWPYLAKATIYDGFKKYYRRSIIYGFIIKGDFPKKEIQLDQRFLEEAAPLGLSA